MFACATGVSVVPFYVVLSNNVQPEEGRVFVKWSRCVADIESGLILSRTHLGCPWVGNVCFGSHHNIETALLWASKMSKSCRILLSTRSKMMIKLNCAMHLDSVLCPRNLQVR